MCRVVIKQGNCQIVVPKVTNNELVNLIDVLIDGNKDAGISLKIMTVNAGAEEVEA